MSQDTEKIVREFGVIGRAVMRESMTRTSCIAAARTTIEVMRQFGLKAYEVPVSFAFHVPARKYARVCGFSLEEKRRMRATAATWREDASHDGNGWNGHLIVFVADRWMIDPAIDQASCEELGVTVPEEALVVDTAGHNADMKRHFLVTLGLRLDSGDEAKLTYQKISKRDYRGTLAWNDEGLPFLAKRIAAEIRLRLKGAHAIAQ